MFDKLFSLEGLAISLGTIILLPIAAPILKPIARAGLGLAIGTIKTGRQIVTNASNEVSRLYTEADAELKTP